MQRSLVNQETSRQLSPTELAAWRGFLRVHSALVRDLDAELRAGHGLSLHEYEVLLYLSDSPDGRLRMSDLAAAVLLSQSGLTRLVDRRGHYAALTPAGRERFRAARTVHRAGVRARFLDRLGEDELHGLAAVWERLVPGATAE
jgi:DNA-binding MarR family transcriptional regulator